VFDEFDEDRSVHLEFIIVLITTAGRRNTTI